jgi:uncharacterized membrane protein (DUF373 family)
MPAKRFSEYKTTTPMLKFSVRFEKIISYTLLGFAMLIIVYQVVQLIWNSVESFLNRFKTVGLEYAPEYGRTITVLFLNILLMMEIMQTIKVFSSNHIIKVRIILIVCLIAVSRKVLALSEQTVDPISELALAALILSLSTGYFLVSRNSKNIKEEEDLKETEN